MRVIVVNDSDGHSNVYEYNLKNMRRLLEFVLEANKHNTMMEDPEAGRQLLQKPDLTAEEIESYMHDWNGPVERRAGGMIFFVDILSGFSEFGSNPFY